MLGRVWRNRTSKLTILKRYTKLRPKRRTGSLVYLLLTTSPNRFSHFKGQVYLIIRKSLVWRLNRVTVNQLKGLPQLLAGDKCILDKSTKTDSVDRKRST